MPCSAGSTLCAPGAAEMNLQALAQRAEHLQHRIDAIKRQCTTGYGCGSTCISLRKECRTRPGSAIGKERLKRLLALAAGGPSGQRGIAPVKAKEAGAMARALTAQRGQQAQQLKAKREQSGLIPTALPFTDAMAARIRKGIEERTMTSGTVNYDGKDLAAAMLKVAQSPEGEHMRKALAFMEEAGIMANIAAKAEDEVERITGGPISNLPWTRPLEMAKFVRDAGLVSDERIEWMRKDQTLAGQADVRRAEIVRNPPKPSAEERLAKAKYEKAKADYKKAEEDIDSGKRWIYGDKKGSLWREKQVLDDARKNYHNMRDGRVNEIKWAAQHFIAGNMTGLSGREEGGYYQNRQKVYVAVGGKTDKSFAGAYKVDANETDPINIRRNYSMHIARHLPEKMAGLADTWDNFDLLHSPIGFNGKTTWAEKALGIHVHELGHVVDSFSDVRVRVIAATENNPEQKALSHVKEYSFDKANRRPEAIKKALAEKRAPSNYALTNDNELFAESFAAWVFAPRALKRHHPDLHAWVEDQFTRARTTMAKNAGLKFVEER